VNDTIVIRIHDRLSLDWLTPSQKKVWEALQRFDGAPHRVINIYGSEGTGKTFMGWLLERLSYSTYCVWPNVQKPLLPRLTLDDIIPDRQTTRNIRPLIDKYSIQQIILLSRTRVDERAMPAFELRITEEDIEAFRANLYRYLQIIVPEEDQRNYKEALETLA
jgi:hypothetical protein